MINSQGQPDLWKMSSKWWRTGNNNGANNARWYEFTVSVLEHCQGNVCCTVNITVQLVQNDQYSRSAWLMEHCEEKYVCCTSK
jgi:hypothetical protein